MKVSIDSRTVQAGDVFIPVKGPNFDGHDFIDEAISKGATVLDVDLGKYAKKYRKKLTCKVIGITGSSGKTTIKDMLASMLSQNFNVTKTKENQNNEYGVPLTVLSADARTDYLIVEMGMRKKGDIKHLTQMVQPDIVIVSNIGLTHIEFFSTQRQLALGKGEIFQTAQKWQTNKRASFINYNTPYHELLAKKASKCGYRVIPFKGEDKWSENVNICFTVCQYLGLEEDVIRKGLDVFETSSHRLKVYEKKDKVIIDDSYNSNPAGIEYALSYLNRFKGRKIAVLGDMLELGEHTQKQHEHVETVAIENQIDIVFTYGEIFKSIIFQNITRVHCDTKETLHKLLKEEIKASDIVLVKGSRGLKMEETVEFLRCCVV